MSSSSRVRASQIRLPLYWALLFPDALSVLSRTLPCSFRCSPVLPQCSLTAPPCSLAAPPCSLAAPPCSLDAPSKAVLLRFLIETGNAQSLVRGKCNVYSFPELRATCDRLLTQASPLCSRAKAHFSHMLPQCSLILPRAPPQPLPIFSSPLCF